MKFRKLNKFYMRPRIRKFLSFLYSIPDTKVLEIKYTMSSYSDFELIKKNKMTQCKNIREAISNILFERGYTPAEISILMKQ